MWKREILNVISRKKLITPLYLFYLYGIKLNLYWSLNLITGNMWDLVK